jgi:hypothetical protein
LFSFSPELHVGLRLFRFLPLLLIEKAGKKRVKNEEIGKKGGKRVRERLGGNNPIIKLSPSLKKNESTDIQNGYKEPKNSASGHGCESRR